MRTIKLVFSLLAMVLLFSCEKGDEPVKVSGTLKNLTGLDGCGWIIEIKQNESIKKLEPTNLSDFNVTLTNGQKVSLSYNETNTVSICMVGQVVQLISIQNE
ncbi:MAG: hypothetical protein H7Y07_05200 [Pyrinomonadaceae bacterium]|nr:hypothetical protein [Sphingobacteriaceae bacterium]